MTSSPLVRVAAFVAGGPIGLEALNSLSERHEVVAVVRPPPRRGLWGPVRARAAALARRMGARPPDPVDEWCRERDITTIGLRWGADADAASVLREAAPDFGCIATFPHRISDRLLEASGETCLNLHPSLLPRHRGPTPLFWTYHAGDPRGGVTVHIATARLDAGPIIGQADFPIARGEAVAGVHMRCARTGGELLARAVAQLAENVARPTGQDESEATPAPRPRVGERYALTTEWAAEQAWHFLAGLARRWTEPLVDPAGRPVRYGIAPGFERRDPRHPPGTVVGTGAGWALWTHDGVVHLAPDPPA